MRGRSDSSPMTRESQVMVLAAEGLTDKQIASQLGISADTVSTYWRRILSRFNAASRTEVVAKMVRQEAESLIAEAVHVSEELRAEVELRKIAEMQLENASARLHTLINHMTSGVLVENEERRIVFVNESFCSTFQLSTSPSSLIGRSCVKMMALSAKHFVDPYRYVKRAEELIESQHQCRSERIELADGRTVERDYTPIIVDDQARGHLWIYRDVTEMVKEERRLVERSELAELLAGIAPDLIRNAGMNTDAAIKRALQTVGEFAHVDRSYVFTFNMARQSMTNTHEWCGPGISSEQENLNDLPLSIFPWWMDKILSGGVVNLGSLEDLPSEATVERNTFESQGIVSLLAVPLFGSSGSSIGFMGFDAVRSPKIWSVETIELLTHLADMVGAVIEVSENSGVSSGKKKL